MLVVFLLGAGPDVVAQDSRLSPDQQQILNSLPPAQRQQALRALADLQAAQSQPSSADGTSDETATDNVIAQSQFDEAVQSATREAQALSQLVIRFTIDASSEQIAREAMKTYPALADLPGTHHYVLSEDGVLSIPGLDPIPLLGMSEADINRRLEAERSLAVFDIEAMILGQRPTGVEALRPFGYDIFVPRTGGLAAPESGPVPSDYILGPGDSVRVQLYGNVNGVYEYEISRDGILNLPEIGPVTAAGISFSEFRADLGRRVEEMLIGTQVSVTMGQLRTIRIFVLGDVNQPGSHIVSGLATISSALYRSGGVSEIGSLRSIEHKRNGKVVGRFDAYDLLLRGDTSGDSRLQPGDVIFVPPVGKTVSVAGAVNRPAIYEVKRLTTAADLVALAGGLKPTADGANAHIDRMDADGGRRVIAVNLKQASANELLTQKGDTLVVREGIPEIGDGVLLAGHVHRPGKYGWHDGMRLTDLIPSVDELKPGVDIDYVLVRRERRRGSPVEVLSASLAEALRQGGSASNIELLPGDTVNVFALGMGRQRVIGPLLNEVELQATIDRPARKVQISGNVRAPGVYPMEEGMRVSDLIRAGGNLAEAAYATEAELTRYTMSAGSERESQTIRVDLDAVRRGDRSADLSLQEHDYLIINRSPEWDSIWTVSLEGEVMFPGNYRVHRGETLADVVKRAGGLTDDGFAEGAVFLRETLRKQEQQQIESLTRRMEADLASLALQNGETGQSETLGAGQTLLQQLRDSEAVGRLVIDLEAEMSGNSVGIELRDGDELLVPAVSQMVTVLGETQQNTSHLFSPSMMRDDYIELSGGFTRRADKKLIYVVRANGAVVMSGSKMFGRSRNTEIRPGDTIVVPLNTDRMRPLTFWTNVSQIIYQGAIAVAAVQAFD